MHSLLFFVQAIVIAFCMVLSLALKYARIRFIVHICMSIILKRSRKGGGSLDFGSTLSRRIQSYR